MMLNPVQILKGDAQEERGETARLSSFVGAIAIGVRATALSEKKLEPTRRRA